jgi:hypothetical protein
MSESEIATHASIQGRWIIPSDTAGGDYKLHITMEGAVPAERSFQVLLAFSVHSVFFPLSDHL